MQWRPSETLAGMITVRTFSELSAAEMWGILHLRSSIFVVEQDCVYLDPDTADFAEGTIHAFIGDDPLYPHSYARLMPLGWPDEHLPTDVSRPIGRVVTAENSRGFGYSAQIIRHLIGIADSEGVATSLNGQAHLESWYGRFGYERCGDNFIEDDIPHVPMVKYTSGPDS